eukprot:XP_002258877.1 KIR protein [Plasmodium knowlesi strain H]
MVVGEGVSSMLPSEQMYSAFEQPSTCSVMPNGPGCNERVKKSVQNGLQRKVISDHESLAKKIVKNHHYACSETGKRTDKAAYYDLCHFLYFWIGGSIKDILNEWNDLTGAMRTIYGNLAGDRCNNGCSVIYTDMSKSNFDWRKIIFDYSYNVSILQSKSTEEKQFICSSDCEQYLQKVKDAYSKVKDSCNGYNLSNDKWCKEFTEEYRTYFDADQPKLTCKAECEPEPPTREQLLSNLPSNLAYDNFNNNWRIYSADQYVGSIKKTLRTTLQRYPDTSKCLDEIVGAWHYATNIMPPRGNPSYAERCDYFYYWLGSKVSDRLKGSSEFAEVMNEIYGKLREIPGTNECGTVTTAVDAVSLIQRKRMFDYYHDYSSLRNMLPNSEPQCNDTFGSYLQGISDAYTAVEGDSRRSPDAYWDKFWGQHKGVISAEIRNLTCTVSPKKPSAGDDFDLGDAVVDGGNEGPDAELKGPKVKGDVDVSLPKVEGGDGNGDGSGGVGGMVGGTLATVGLPAIGFYLYKYTDVFDGIKKSLFGGSNNTVGRNRNRGRRSTIRHQHFDDTFTENGSSTLGDDGSTTLGGGGGGGSSTLGGSSTDISTIYNEPTRRPTGRRERAGTNNRRQGNIRYYAT